MSEENNTKESVTKDNTKYKDGVNRNARLIIRNVSFKATEKTLKEHFSEYGNVEEVKLLKKPDGKLVGCGFVHFTHVPMAKKALTATNNKPFLGRPISVDWAVPKYKYMQFMVNQQLEMQDIVKKEESDNEDEGTSLNVSSEDVKDEVKSESEDSIKEESDSETSDKSDDDSSDDDDGSNDEKEMDKDDVKSEDKTQPDRQGVKLNDAEDGCTVFVTNIPFSVDDEQLRGFVENIAPVKYALVCVDKLTEHSKGSGFVKFTKSEDAETFLSLPADKLKLEGQVLQVKPALKRENLQKNNKQPKDNRNLYLVKEGVIVAGTKAAAGVSALDMAKRLALERSKTQMLKNLNRFVSRYRLVVSNLPAHYNDNKLRATCAAAAGKRAVLTEARVMRDLRAPVEKDGKHPSKGFGFVMFMRHEDALACLRKLNNNPDIFDKINRPIVSFSIEDRTALNARKKRLEKSIANNPLSNKSEENSTQNKKKNRKRKAQTQPDESYVKKGRFQKKKDNNIKQNVKHQNVPGKFVRRPVDDDVGEYSGLTAKEGSQHKIRSNFKLKKQADIHRENVKIEKKNSKRAWRLKMAAKERVKQPKQKVNKNPNKKRNKHRIREIF